MMSAIENAITCLEEALHGVGQEMGAAECHGLLTGLLCADPGYTVTEWCAQMAQGGNNDLLTQEAMPMFKALHAETRRQLGDTLLDFYPLLPMDDEPLNLRVEALAEWVQGFLLGLIQGGIKEGTSLPGGSGEILKDMIEISSAADFTVEGGEEDEQAYMELLEYIRTAVLLINEELAPAREPLPGDVTVH